MEEEKLDKNHGPTCGNGYWRIEINEEIYCSLKYPDIVNIIKVRRLEWLGHLARMYGEWAVKNYCKENRAVEEKNRTRLRRTGDGYRIGLGLEKFRCKELWKKKIIISLEESVDHSYKGFSAKEEEEEEKEEKEGEK